MGTLPEKYIDVYKENYASLNFVSLMNKDVLIAVAKEFVQCKVVGNMNKKKTFARFLKNYLQAIWGLGYARRKNDRYITGMYSEELLQKKSLFCRFLWIISVR